VALSTELRRWFNHDPARWEEFWRRYRTELRQKKDAVEGLRQWWKGQSVIFVYPAHDEKHNGALVSKDYLEQHEP
jgi:uncharacterized protein YeaO (DUF488 family)